MSDRVVLVAVGLVLALVATRLRAAWRSRRARRRLARARAGERSAPALLARHGYELVGEQVPGTLVLRVDGAESLHALRADFLVARDGRRWVAEVKTGARAPSLEHAPTRRQIVEYCAAFDVEGALLVDPESDRIYEIGVPFARSRPSRWPWVLVALGAAALVLLTTR